MAGSFVSRIVSQQMQNIFENLILETHRHSPESSVADSSAWPITLLNRSDVDEF
jgi:hypothetical protein